MRLRTIRERHRRSRKGQVSAVATILGLLLVVSFVANYIADVLPGQMEVNEVSHVLTVQDQIGRLQAILYAGSTHARHSLPLIQPITLGSSGQPPFGAPDSGALTWDGLSARTSVSDTVGAAQYAPPTWGHGNLCTSITSSACTNSQSNVCSPPMNWNESANNTAFTFSLTGSNNCIHVNITGNNDVFTMGVTGSNLGYFILTMFGFNDSVVLNNHFSGSGFHAYFYLYGGNNSYVGSGGPTGSNVFLNTFFIGQLVGSPTCGIGNLSATDHWSITGSSASNSVQNFTWYNLVGHSTPYHTTSGWPGSGNSGTGNRVGWQNISTSTSCAFWSVKGLSSTAFLGSGVIARLSNVYISSADVAYEYGAEIYAQVGGIPVMLSGPEFRLGMAPGGALDLTVWLPEFEGSVATETGVGTAAILLQPVQETSVTLPTTGSTSTLLAPPSLVLQTYYPQAWLSYFAANPTLFPSGGSCSGANCTALYNPANGLSTVTATFVAVPNLTIQVALFSVTLD